MDLSINGSPWDHKVPALEKFIIPKNILPKGFLCEISESFVTQREDFNEKNLFNVERTLSCTHGKYTTKDNISCYYMPSKKAFITIDTTFRGDSHSGFEIVADGKSLKIALRCSGIEP